MIEKVQFLNTEFLKSDEIKLVAYRFADGNPERNWVPAYHFHICDLQNNIMGAVICVLDILMDSIMGDILDTASARSTEDIIMQRKPADFCFL